MEIDCFLAQILGARDSFLFQINQKLGLGVDDKNVELGSVQAELSKKGKGNLLRYLHVSMKMNNWLWLLNEFRNQTMHRSFIRRHIAAGSNAAKISFIYKKKSKVKVGKIIQEIEEEKMKK